ncbi:TIGR03668 family PPOX class F420-dependent oxidoreductase [Geodermatophilus sp. YIM 151500]|uniref:TIGR03668 family PPOX class F420-dependent oxidoreductase n=1 Tax=Geodermatophilus sp. YIM 151500 TaxID=2984531 RepID=UPI0021E46E09|nr:TIGR03668 family PPOX class F420-dependent oxidoreductase [Geodermatophilus sp. YIM 151500]MCV2487754.1 TIGR03668 family PPOX class F420-dependent oxidoreductase [Geodermatophilus sp. YIM 151500]
MRTAELRQRFAGGDVARLATVRPDGWPHVVVVVFAVVGETVFTAVDRKPKRTTRLQRLENLRHEPRCSLLVDHYEDDWTRLWWVRADGRADVVDEPPASHPGLSALADRHPPYRTDPPHGPLIAVRVERWSGWTATP